MWVQRNEAEVQQYWKQYLTGTSPCILQQGPSTDFGHGTRKLVVPFNDARRLNLFCQEQSITVAMFTRAAWAVMLKLHASLTQVCFGCLRSDQEALPKATGILGPLISMLPCKFNFDDLKKRNSQGAT